jgi:hypothetical protein
MDVESGGSPWELYLAFIECPSGLIGRVQFDPQTFDMETINRMLRDFERLFQAALASPEQRISNFWGALERQ